MFWGKQLLLVSINISLLRLKYLILDCQVTLRYQTMGFNNQNLLLLLIRDIAINRLTLPSQKLPHLI
jgi:hypothetical protein